MSRSAIALVTLALVGYATDATKGDALFEPTASVDVTAGPGEVLLADVDRDGRLDLVTQHLLQRMVAVHVGDGDGSFAAIATEQLELSYEPAAIALGDVNEDGFLDLAVASRDSNSEYVHVILAQPAGGFSAASGTSHAIAAAGEAYKPRVLMADLNEDGHLDIVAANARRNSIEILLGDGAGTFLSGPTVTLDDEAGYHSFDVADIDGDGHLDLLVASGGAPGIAERIAMKRGDGRAGFHDAPASVPSVPAEPRVLALADVDEDQDIDIVLGHANRHDLSVLLNAGQDVFAPAPGSPYELADEAFAVVLADANGDRHPDLLAATVDSVTVLLGDGRAFASAPGSPFRAEPGAYNLAAGDLNGDGRADLAVPSFEGDSVTVLLGATRD